MIFYYTLKDTNTDESQLYSVEASYRRDADEIFIRNFFPMLPNVDCMDFTAVINICGELDYELTCFDPIRANKLK